MNNAKPILVIKMPTSASLEMISQYDKYLKQKNIGDDYHVLIVSSRNENGVDVEVFYNNDIKETDIEQLKQLVKDGFENLDKE